MRRATAWISTVVVAIAVAMALPVSQLRTVAIVHSCCCPDPDNCHCPTEKADHSKQPSLRTCHNSSQVIVSPAAPAFAAPALAVATVPAIAERAIEYVLPVPHPAPPPARPAAPS